MVDVRVRPSIRSDISVMARTLRELDREEALALGFLPYKGLWLSYRRSMRRMTILVDGEIASMSGIAGTPMGMVGVPYLITGPAFARAPLAVSRIGRYEAGLMLDWFPVLVNHIKADYHQAIRFARMLGFEIGEPQPMGVHGELFRRMEMRA